MKFVKLFLITLLSVFVSIQPALAKDNIASAEDIDFLKRDILEGRIEIGKTRLKKIKEVYGSANSINETATKITHDYGDLKIDFSKDQYLRDWGYDYSRIPGYSDDIEDLRFDLLDGQIVGDFVTLREIKGDYGDPTEVIEKTEDGEMSTYYYTEIKLVFENVYTVRSWKGKRFKAGDTQVFDGNYSTGPSVSEEEEPVRGGLY